jgi:uncharacterized membrane protein
VTKEQWLLGFHLLSAFLFVGGAVMAGFLHTAAMLRDRPSEVALLLKLTRVGVVVIGVGALAALGFGAWLVSAENLHWRDAWLTWGLALWVISLALGGLGGRPLRQARELAERLVTLGDQRSPELRRAVANPVGLALNYGSLAVSLALLGLMIWKPV